MTGDKSREHQEVHVTCNPLLVTIKRISKDTHMNDFLKQDIFFFVTTIAVVILTILLAILIAYLIKISNDVRYITTKAKSQADLISEDISNLRTDVKEHGAKLKYFASFFSNLMKKSNKKK